MKLRIVLAGLIFGSVAIAAETGAELFQKALTAERAAGNLEEAIKLYQRIAKDFASDRALAAKALVQEARCYEKLGKDNAVRIYQQVARDYRDQPEPSATAKARLAALKLSDRPAGPAGMTQRKIELPFPHTLAILETDGQRAVYKDATTGALMIGDLAGKDKRVILKPKQGEQIDSFIPSRDLSSVALALRVGSGSKGVVLKTDGTGYREFSVDYPFEGCPADWSWDNRYLFRCTRLSDGTRQLQRVSMADGEVRKLGRANTFNRPSPDGRFIASAEAYEIPSGVSIMSSQGGAPELVADNAHLVDWTRDGRYLIITSASSGSEALFLLPVKDGQRAGDPVFIRYGTCFFGTTVANGGLVCHSTFPGGGSYEAWLGSLDLNGHGADWNRMNFHGLGGYSSWFVRWSPDSTQISYGATEEGARIWAVRLRNISSGEEREVYRGSITLGCTWAAQRPALFCVDATGRLSSIAIDSQRLEPLGIVSGFSWNERNFYVTSSDDRAVFWRDYDSKLFRWDVRTQQSTPVDRTPGSGMPFPDEHWLARRDKDKIEIRPMAGGQWKSLISTGETQMAFTPDGKWVLYHDVDATGKHSLFRVSTAGGQPERIGDFPNVRKEHGIMTVSPDGQKIVAQAPGAEELWILDNFEPKQTAAR